MNKNYVHSDARRSSSEQTHIESEIRTIFEKSISFNEYLGFKVMTLSSESVVIGFDMRPELIGHFLHGRLHGGVISSVLDATGGLAVMWAVAEYHQPEKAARSLERFATLGTIDLRVDYLRQGIGENFQASATVARLGRRIATAHMKLTNQDNQEIATGTATYIVS